MPDQSNNNTTESAFPIREYLGVLYQRRIGFILAVIVVVCLGVAYTLNQPKIYQASTTIIIDPELKTVSAIETNDYNSNWYLRDTYYDTQLKIIQSRSIAQRVVNDLGLAQDIDFLNLSEIKDPQKLQKRLEHADAVSHLLHRLKVEAQTGTRLVTITFKDQNPERAAQIANAVAQSFAAQNAELRLASLNKTSEFILQQNDDNQKKLDQARENLNQFQQEHNILYSNPTEQQKITNARLTSLYNKRIEIETEREHVGYTLSELTPYPLKYENAQTYAAIMNYNARDLGLSDCTELKKQEQKLLTTYLETAPQVATIHRQYEACVDETLATMKSMKDGLNARHQALTKLNNELNAEVAKLQKEALQLDQLRLLYEQFESQKNEQERLFSESQRKMNEVSLNQLLEINNIRILDPAIVPHGPVSPNLLINGAFTLLAALFAGLFVVLMLELLDITVRTQNDIEARAKMPFLGSVPRFNLLKTGRHAYRFILEHPHSPLTECIRTLRTTIAYLLPHDGPQILLVTSAQPYDGKTMTSLNLAVTTALAGKKCVLIEADMRRPKLYKALKTEQQVGLAQLIEGRCKLDEAIFHTEVECLDLLPCGQLPETPAELFQTEAFPRLLDQLRGRYDMIVIDTPPVTVVSDALNISHYVNGVIVVARANKTPMPRLIRTRELLDGVNAPIMGVVLNDVKATSQGYNYGYYYTHEYK